MVLRKIYFISTATIFVAIAFFAWVTLETSEEEKDRVFTVDNSDLAKTPSSNVTTEVERQTDSLLQPPSASELEAVLEESALQTLSPESETLRINLADLNQTLNELDQNITEKGIHQPDHKVDTEPSKGAPQESMRLENIRTHTIKNIE